MGVVCQGLDVIRLTNGKLPALTNAKQVVRMLQVYPGEQSHLCRHSGDIKHTEDPIATLVLYINAVRKIRCISRHIFLTDLSSSCPGVIQNTQHLDRFLFSLYRVLLFRERSMHLMWILHYHSDNAHKINKHPAILDEETVLFIHCKRE